MVATSRSLRRSVRARRVLVVNSLALLIAVPALAYSIVHETPSGIVSDAQGLVAGASASLSASVPANPYNTLAAQLDDEKAQLDSRATELNAQQSAAAAQNSLERYMTFASFGMSLMVLLLVGLNFYFDMRRRSGKIPGFLEKKFLIDLR